MEVLWTWFKKTRAFLGGLILGVFLMQLAVLVIADSGVVRPDGNGTTVAGTAIGCTSSSRFECINDVVTQPTAPTTGTDYLQMANNDTYHALLGNTVTDVSVVTAAQVWVHHREGGSNARTNVGLYTSNENTAIGAQTVVANRTSAQWDSVLFTGLSLNQTQLDDMRLRVACSKQGGGASTDCFINAAYVELTYDPLIEATVGSTGSQQNLDIGSKNAHIGGAFSVRENVSSRNVTSVTIAETGSVDAANDLKNVRLFYETDTTGADGYNCSDQTFSGTEQQYGATSTNGFSGANGTITFTESVGITTTQSLCLYPVMDIATTSSAGERVEVQITDPSTQVSISGTETDVVPATAVALSGSTVIQAQDRTQVHYHWRNDVGGEGASNSATGGTEDTPLNALGVGQDIRLRIGVSNEGNRMSDATQYRLEYGQKATNCDAITNWIDVGAGGGDFDMNPTANLTEGANTTNVPVADGGVSNENLNYLTTNGGVRDTTSQTGNITLTSSEYVDLEYSIIPTGSATAGNNYCFRVSNAGTELESYAESTYAQATILADVTVSTAGTMQNSISIPASNVVTDAYFRINDNITGDATVQSLTLTASGTIDEDADLANVALWYDLDITGADSFNCSDQTFDGNETQFGATSTSGFTSGEITFTDSQVVNASQSMCIYVVYSSTGSVSDGETLELFIENASNDVTIDSGTIAPNALVQLSGESTFVTDLTRQVHYHWRNDNGNELDADSATNDTEDTLLENLRAGVPARLRIGIANDGTASAATTQFRLEYALKVTTCAAVSNWTDVGATDDAFNMFNSPNFTDGANTTNIAEADGGVTDESDTYLSSNGALKDTSSQTGNITLAGKNFVDLEYSIVASSTATEGAIYCFRASSTAGTMNGYDTYPEVEIKPKTDYFIQRDVTPISGTSATIVAGTDYVAPSDPTRAFVRIVGTNHIGAGSPTNSGAADDTTVHISNPSNIGTSVTFTRPAAAANTTRIAWEIIEYVGGIGGDNEMIVRDQGTATYGTGATTVTTGAVGSIADDADVAVFITGQSNPDTATNYSLGLSTAAWNSGADTATFTRGGSGNAATVSYAVVEFTGDNWAVQRAEHTYSAAGSTETESISSVNSLSRAFVHDQKRMASGLNNHSDFGHNVWLSSIGAVSFLLDNSANSPGSHTSVAWVIENTQDVGDTMIVSPSNSSESAGTAPKTVTNAIGATISDTQDASLFINNTGNETGGGSGQNSFPEPLVSAQLINETQFEYYVGDPDNDSRTWRAQVVEWPTAARNITQNRYQFFVNNDALTPTDPWPAGATDIGESTEVTENDGPIALTDTMRLRMTLQISSAAMEPGIDNFILQYGERSTTCTAIGENDWHDVGEIGSTTALWRGTTTSQTDGEALSTDPPTGGDLLITAFSDVAGTLEEENPSAVTPYRVNPGEDVEFDWVVQHNGATEKTTYCFRMLEADGDQLEGNNTYPAMRTAGYSPIQTQWRFFDDETNITPTSPLATENTAPIDIEYDNTIKLRTTVHELTGGEGTDIKFKLQYSEYSNFSTAVFDVASSSVCAAQATSSANIWCYDDGGAGVDNGVIDSAVLSDADTCTGGSGAGCGTHNESVSTSTATFDHPAYAATEYEFTIRNDGARPNTVYYFRLVDLTNNATITASTSYPSLQTAGPELVFSVSGLPVGTTTEGVTSDIETTATAVDFGSVPFDIEYEGIYRLKIDTGATEGFQVFMYANSPLQNSYGEQVPPIGGTNASPIAWSSGCADSTLGCFGYHSGDDILGGGSTRFSADNTYAAFSSDPEEIMFSSAPGVDIVDIVYKIQVGQMLTAGDYETEVVYLAVPSF